jgi:hypothetical protein
MRRHSANYTGLLSGLLFIGLGTYALAVGPDRLGDALRWVWPVTLLGLGIALLVGSSASEHRPRHEVGTEGGQDREVEQAGSSHDG